MGERVTAPEARGAQVVIGVPEEEEEWGGAGMEEESSIKDLKGHARPGRTRLLRQ